MSSYVHIKIKVCGARWSFDQQERGFQVGVIILYSAVPGSPSWSA